MIDTSPENMSFKEAFDLFIRGKRVVDWGFRHPFPVLLPNGFKAFPCGYYTLYENGYKFIAHGFSLGAEQAQEAMILDPNDVPVGYKDREDILDQDYL